MGFVQTHTHWRLHLSTAVDTVVGETTCLLDHIRSLPVSAGWPAGFLLFAGTWEDSEYSQRVSFSFLFRQKSCGRMLWLWHPLFWRTFYWLPANLWTFYILLWSSHVFLIYPWSVSACEALVDSESGPHWPSLALCKSTICKIIQTSPSGEPPSALVKLALVWNASKLQHVLASTQYHSIQLSTSFNHVAWHLFCSSGL